VTHLRWRGASGLPAQLRPRVGERVEQRNAVGIGPLQVCEVEHTGRHGLALADQPGSKEQLEGNESLPDFWESCFNSMCDSQLYEFSGVHPSCVTASGSISTRSTSKPAALTSPIAERMASSNEGA
jgi:hypothetical protein